MVSVTVYESLLDRIKFIATDQRECILYFPVYTVSLSLSRIKK